MNISNASSLLTYLIIAYLISTHNRLLCIPNFRQLMSTKACNIYFIQGNITKTYIGIKHINIQSSSHMLKIYIHVCN